MRAQCQMDDCKRQQAAKGLCLMHYKRMCKWGSPLIVRPVRDPVDRFADKAALTDSGCLEWQGMRNPAGYGIFTIGDQYILAHRWSHEHAIGPLGELLALHRCDNPPCVLPDHLFAGTHADNAQDKVAKGRAVAPNAAPSRCVNGHEMTLENTYVGLQSNGLHVHRNCRKCHAEREARRRNRKVS